MSCYSIWPIHKRNRFFQNILDKIVSKTKLSFGYCNICGRVTAFYTNVPLRENGRCFFCHSQNRERQLVYIFLKLINKQNFLSSLQSIKDTFSISPIWICQQNSPLSNYLKKIFADNCITSEFFDESLKSGEIINNIMHIDMRNTYFNNRQLKYIFSGDVIEHIPNYLDAMKEIYRILDYDGCHIFTVPFYQHAFCIDRRAELINGKIIKHRKDWFHIDPVRPDGILCYNIFAPELLCELEKIGFKVSLYLVHEPKYGIFGGDGLVIVAKKVKYPIKDIDYIYDSPLLSGGEVD